MDDLAGRTAADLAQLVRSRQASPGEVLRAHLDRFEAADPALHAFQTLRAERALTEAALLEKRDDLAELPLAGVPVAIKDEVDVAGEPTRFGSAASSPDPRAGDSELVRRLRRAGCVVIGKTTVPELMIWPFTETAAFGDTRNPWNPARTPGGSSGGSAAAVAAGIVPLALGSDGGGSIRIPAAACGIFGLKPGPGLVPQGGGWFGNSEFGPLATTIADAALMLEALTGKAGLGAVQPEPGRLRIALSRRSPARGVRLHADVARCLEATGGSLRESGHEVVEADPPYPEALALPFLRRFLAGIAVAAEGMDAARLEPRTRRMVRSGRRLRENLDDSSSDRWYLQADSWLRDFDLMLSPVVAGPAPAVGRWRGQGVIRTLLGVTQWVPYTPPWNLGRFPCAAVPSGFADDGLPVAVQLLGPRGSEPLLLAVAAQLERNRPWPRQAPALPA